MKSKTNKTNCLFFVDFTSNLKKKKRSESGKILLEVVAVWLYKNDTLLQLNSRLLKLQNKCQININYKID